MDGHRGDSPPGGGDDRDVRAGRDVARGEDVRDRGMLGVVHDDHPVLIALAAELDAEVVGRVVADGEEEALAVQVHAALELELADLAPARGESRDALHEHGDVERVELREVGGVDLGRLAIRADDEIPRPGSEGERQSRRLPAGRDDDRLAAARLVAVAVRAVVRGLAVAALEPGNVGPDVLDPDGDEEALRLDHAPALEDETEVLVAHLRGGLHAAVHQLRAEAPGLVPPALAQLGWRDVGEAEVPMDAARLPVARVARIDDHHRVQVAAEPDGRAEAGRPPPTTAAS